MSNPRTSPHFNYDLNHWSKEVERLRKAIARSHELLACFLGSQKRTQGILQETTHSQDPT